MKKGNALVLALTIVGSILFALGMCMCMVEGFGIFGLGLGLGIAGAIILPVTWLVLYRKVEGLAPLKMNPQTVSAICYGVFGTLIFGAGMCMMLIWSLPVWGIVVGIVGIGMMISTAFIFKKIK